MLNTSFNTSALNVEKILLIIQKLFESLETRVYGLFAAALAFIEVGAAELADAFAILFAQNLAGQGEENILPHKRIKLKMHILNKNQLVVLSSLSGSREYAKRECRKRGLSMKRSDHQSVNTSTVA